MCELGIAYEAHGTQCALPYEHALCISLELAQADHTTGVQVQTYSKILICLWGVERVVYHWCQPKENFFTPLFPTAAFRSPKVYLPSDWHVVCQLLPDTKSSITQKGFQGACKSQIDMQFACKQQSKTAQTLNQTACASLWIWCLINCTHICGQWMLVS